METPRNDDKNHLILSSAKRPTHTAESVCQPVRNLRRSQEGFSEHDSRSAHSGLDPKQAIRQWLQFAHQAGHIRVTGQRAFCSDLERIETMEEEAGSLFDYARSIGLVFPERFFDIAQNSPARKGGAEHKVFFDIADQKGRVVKVTFPDKFGRWEHTPFLYLERCQLLNEMVPVLDIRLEGCIQTERKELSLVTSMQFFAGKHPSSQEADRFVRSLDFEPLKDASDTLDYINHQSRLILRDCHPLNWIKAKRGLIPIDIIPERFLG